MSGTGSTRSGYVAFTSNGGDWGIYRLDDNVFTLLALADPLGYLDAVVKLAVTGNVLTNVQRPARACSDPSTICGVSETHLVKTIDAWWIRHEGRRVGPFGSQYAALAFAFAKGIPLPGEVEMTRPARWLATIRAWFRRLRARVTSRR